MQCRIECYASCSCHGSKLDVHSLRRIIKRYAVEIAVVLIVVRAMFSVKAVYFKLMLYNFEARSVF